MTSNYLELLPEYCGYDQFRPGQAEALAALAKKRHVLAILPTGGGKSLIYQLFQFHQSGHTVIVSPLIALMQDQVQQLQQHGLKAVIAINSSMDRPSQRYALANLAAYQFIFISPEMIQRADILAKLKALDLRLLVIDEAHCISQWGYDFRPEYTELRFIRQQLNWPLTLGLTATASKQTIADIRRYLFAESEKCELIKTSIDRENIFYAFEKVPASEKMHYLQTLLSQLTGPGIVYVHQKQELEEIVTSLKKITQLRIESYHADRSLEDRHIIQSQFISGEIDVVFATSAFGMGVNHHNVRFVIHYHLPQSIEELIQEMGRAGRDGQQAVAIIMANQSELKRLRFIDDNLQMEQQHLTENLHMYQQLKPQLQQAFISKLNETQQAFIRFYLQHFTNMEEIEQHQHLYFENKRRQLRGIMQLLTQKTCYRDTFLTQFGEVGGGSSAFCCSNCQREYQELPQWKSLTAADAILDTNGQKNTDWRTRLEKLLSPTPE